MDSKRFSSLISQVKKLHRQSEIADLSMIGEILDDVASAHPLKVRAIDEARIKTDKVTAAYR